MKNSKKVIAFILIVFIMYFVSGCAEVQNTNHIKNLEKNINNYDGGAVYNYEANRKYRYKKKGSYNEVIPCPMKDFIVKGRIYVESKVAIDVNGEKNGSEITDYMLLKEAEKIGADDVINVKIDEQEDNKIIDKYNEDAEFLNRKYIQKVYIYKATALAIKYTEAIKDVVPQKNIPLKNTDNNEEKKKNKKNK